MLRSLEVPLYQILAQYACWWGIRRFKPRPDQLYRSRLLLAICLIYGLPLAALAYGLFYALEFAMRSVNPLADDTSWLPRAAAWTAFVINALLNGLTCWLWNRRAVRLGALSRADG